MKTSIVLFGVLALVALTCVAATTLHGDAERHRIIGVVNAANKGWTAGLNSRWAGKPIHAIKRQLGVLDVNPPAWKKPALHVHTGFDIAALPVAFDARTQWPKCPSIQEIRDQSDCGSCWAFGAVEAATDRICIDTNGANLAHLSAEDMTSCCTSCGFGCDGGDPGAAWDYLASTGIVTGGNYNDFSWCSSYSLPNCDHHVVGKYAPCGAQEYPTPNCPNSCDPQSTYKTPFGNDAHIFNSSYSVSSDPAQIQQEIMTRGPVEAAFSVYADFESYKSGVYQHVTGDYLGGHAVKILGWGVDAASNLPYWLVANSWNTDWGELGFFRILRGADECGIEDSIVAGQFSP
jgi:cathepsin B